MIYLSQILGIPVLDAEGERIGVVNDLGIATREVFPRVTSLAFQGPGKTPFMISWRKYVASFDENEVRLSVPATDIRFSYLQPDEVLIARDLLNKQIVDTRGMRVVRVNDLKLSDTSSSQLRLLGAEVGIRDILRAISPALERLVMRCAHALGNDIPEKIIAWNYMDLLDRDLSQVRLSISHQTLDDLHPADIADIIEQLDPRLRGQVFAQLDDAQAAETMAELDDDEMAAKIMGDMDPGDASRMLSEMDPDDAAELVGELDYEKAERLLRLMGIKEQRAVRQLLGYKDDTAGRIMTSEFVAMKRSATVADAAARISSLDDDFEPVNYVYLTNEDGRLDGVVTVRRLFIAQKDECLGDLDNGEDLIVANPDDDQEDVAENIAKYNLLAVPVVDENHKILGIVTVDDALDVLEEEHEEDLHIAGGSSSDSSSREKSGEVKRLFRRQMWFFFWIVMAGIMAITLGAEVGMACAFAAPVALLVSDEMASYVTAFFIEHDPDDEDAPSPLGFAIRGIGLGLLWAAVVLLVSLAGIGLIGAHVATQPLVASFEAAAGATLFSFATSPAYLMVLRHRDEEGKETSGVALRAVALMCSALVFMVLVIVLSGGLR